MLLHWNGWLCRTQSRAVLCWCARGMTASLLLLLLLSASKRTACPLFRPPTLHQRAAFLLSIPLRFWLFRRCSPRWPEAPFLRSLISERSRAPGKDRCRCLTCSPPRTLCNRPSPPGPRLAIACRQARKDSRRHYCCCCSGGGACCCCLALKCDVSSSLQAREGDSSAMSQPAVEATGHGEGVPQHRRAVAGPHTRLHLGRSASCLK